MREHYIKDKRLSLKAKGLLAILIECDVEITSDNVNIFVYTGDKDVTVNSALAELKKYGYVLEMHELRGDDVKSLGLKAFAYAQS